MNWISDLRRLTRQQPAVLVTLIHISGSAPRESGCRMVVGSDAILGSIGGGNLEYQAIAMARELLVTAQPGSQQKKLYGLGPELNQCCGGAVALHYEVVVNSSPDWLTEADLALELKKTIVVASALDSDEVLKQVIHEGSVPEKPCAEPVLSAARELLRNPGGYPNPAGVQVETDTGAWWLERVCNRQRPIMLFGAGHVGQAVALVLQPLPFELTWVDSREGVFPDIPLEGVRMERNANPASMVAQTAPDTIFIVMTHSHQLDEDICFEILSRESFGWLGLIGSATKKRRFVHRLERRGIAPARLERLVCPIGLAGIRGKQPATIALSLAAQLMTQPEE